MDLLLPDEASMRLMQREFDRLNVSSKLKAVTSALGVVSDPEKTDRVPQNSLHMRKMHSDAAVLRPISSDENAPLDAPDPAPIFASASPVLQIGAQKAFAVAVLYLYFVRVLSYNIGYGTEIYDSRRGLGRLQPVSLPFGELNGLC